MKKAVCCVILFYLFSIQNSFGSDMVKMDSLFTFHIKSLDSLFLADTPKISMTKDDVVFLHMITFIAEIKYPEQGFTHTPIIKSKDVKEIKKWYARNRKRLNWSKIEKYMCIERGYNNAYMLINPEDSTSYDLYDRRISELDLELDSLRNVNSYIKK